MRVAVVGAGGHSLSAHLPALAALADQRGLELVGIADRAIDAARSASARFGVAQAFDDPERMVDVTSPDVCLLLVPSSAGPGLALSLAPRVGVCLVEKPLAVDLARARAMVDELERLGARVMVSANRRFDPGLTAGLAWFGDRPRAIDATMSRTGRREPAFMPETAVHLVDAVRHIAHVAPVASASVEVAGSRWFTATLAGEAGLRATVHVAPTAGMVAEQITLRGAERTLRVGFGVAPDSGVEGWIEGERVLRIDTSQLAPWERDGTLAETEALLDFAQGDHESPVSPREYLGSMEMIDAIVADADR